MPCISSNVSLNDDSCLLCTKSHNGVAFAHRDASRASPCFLLEVRFILLYSRVEPISIFGQLQKKRRVNNYISFKTVREKSVVILHEKRSYVRYTRRNYRVIRSSARSFMKRGENRNVSMSFLPSPKTTNLSHFNNFCNCFIAFDLEAAKGIISSHCSLV